MNKSLLKNFATAARIRLMDDVRYRLGLMGITAKGILAPAHQSLDMEAYEYAKGQTFRLTGQEVAARRTLADMVRARGFEQVVEEVAYTWFNRLIAIRFMEVNDYLPHHTRVLSSITPGQTTPDIVTRALEVDLGLTDKEKQQVLEWKLNNQTDDLFRFMFLKQCQQLAGLLPGLFSGQGSVVSGQLAGVSGLSSAGHWSLKTDHLSLLLTISHINPDGIVAQLLKIPESYFSLNQADEDGEATGQVEIIGWLYQYYNSELKDDTFAQLKKNIKISKERIPAATQLFTPQWIVKYMVENSLGRLWVEKLLADGDSRTEAEIAEAFGWRYYLPVKSGQGSVFSEQGTGTSEQLSVISDQSFNPVPTDHCPLTTDHSLGSTDHLESPEDLRFLDPAMGSGHILVYAFDVLMQIYLSRGYGAADATRLIVEKNLHGLDIDDRAWQLAYFAVMMKARQHRRQALTEGLQPHLYAVQSSQGLSDQQLQYFGKNLSSLERNMARDQAEEMLQLFKDGKLLGSIIRVPDWDLALLERFAMDFTLPKQVDLLSDLYAEGAQPHLLQLVRIARVMQQRYHAVVTNPPYMGAIGMNAALSSYVKEEYPDSKSDLFAVFMERCCQWTVISDQWSGVSGQSGYVGMITQHAWMFLSSYEKLRGKLLKQQEIINMAHLGARAFEEIGGEVVQTTAFVMGKKAVPGYLGTYARLIEPTTQDGKEEMFLLMKKGSEQCSVISDQTPTLVPADHCPLTTDHSFHHADQQNFTKIPGAPVAYWAGGATLKAFSKFKLLDRYALIKQGLKTGQNDLFLRNWFEINNQSFSIKNGEKWYPCNKGGDYRKWFGNNEYVIDWENNGQKLKDFKHPDGRQKSRPQNIEFMLREGLTYSNISSSDLSIRYSPSGFIFDAAGSMIFPHSIDILYLLGFLSSKIVKVFTSVLSPTLSFEVGQISLIPCFESNSSSVVPFVRKNIDISKIDWDSFETSWDFKHHPMISEQFSVVSGQDSNSSSQPSSDHCPLTTDHSLSSTAHYSLPTTHPSSPTDHCSLTTDHSSSQSSLLTTHYASWKQTTTARFTQLKANEEELNRIFIDIYGLQDELSPEVADRDVTVYRIIDEPDVEERKMRYVLSRRDAIITLISYAVGCMLGRYSLDVEGLAYAGGGFSEQWTVISGQYYRKEVVEKHGCKTLSGFGGVAEGDGLGSGGLQIGEAAAQRGAVWVDKPDAQGGNFHPLQHRGGTGEELDQGIHTIPGNRPGQQGGATNAAAAMRAPGISDPGTNEDSTCPYRRIGKDGVCIEAGADHCPLTTDHFPADADNILPITDEEYFGDDIVTRFADWVRVAYGTDTLEENLRFVADALGGSGTAREVIRNYFLKDFYKDHVKTYKKRPIYWLFDSGKQNGFKALIYLHRYDRDTLGRVRVDYLHRLQAMYENAVGSCDSILASNASTAEKGRTTKRREKLLRQLDECRSYDQALAHLANQRISIDLDDGVKHNYALFQGVELAREGRRAVKVDLLATI